MNIILVLIAALAISMVVIPFMLRLAPRLGLVDRPSARKVHSVPMARVGGWGIVLGAVVPVAIWLPLADPLVQTYLFGSLVLLAFGTWDDSREVGHYAKFVGQFLAVIPVVTYGGLYVDQMPFADLGARLDPAIGIPFTAIAMVGVINAINHSDGLDGLAGGEALLSLIAILMLAYLAGDSGVVLVIALAAIGGTLGFLRYNTHPARLFMGDSGSQFLGFSLAFLVVLLTQQVNEALAPAVVALLLGLPVIDIVTVLAQRIHQGLNWFRATKNHIHHRLLDLGFDHHESVVIIYSVQALFVLSGVLLRYAHDGLILGIYLGYAVLLFVILVRAKRRGWQARRERAPATRFSRLVSTVRQNAYCASIPLGALMLLVPGYLVVGAFYAGTVPRDFGLMSAVLLAVLVVELFLRNTVNSVTARGIVYAVGTFIVYLAVEYPVVGAQTSHAFDLAFFSLVGVAIALGVRCAREREFRTTPMDYLVVFVVLTLGLFSGYLPAESNLTLIAIKAVILLYGCELLLHNSQRRWNPVSLAAIAALGTLSVRGLV